jgi:effector-binding domain-containing protein
MAKIVHYGPYEDCEPTYDKLFKWFTDNDKEISGPIREVYLNDPKEVKKEEIMTEIYAPIK